MKSLRYKASFTKDLKKVAKRKYDLRKLEATVIALRTDEPLAASMRPHRLKGEWASWWECHIIPDWLLIYKIEKTEVLLARTGTHADLFGE
jgi:mRNA interferase YafQ